MLKQQLRHIARQRLQQEKLLPCQSGRYQLRRLGVADRIGHVVALFRRTQISADVDIQQHGLRLAAFPVENAD